MPQAKVPLVSVIIPCYNAEAWLAETLRSVVEQSHDNLQVIAVDDGSKDGTWQILSQCKDRRLNLFKQSNSGAGAARNVGLAHATGEWIQFLDADDILERDKIARQLNVAQSLPPGWVLGAGWGRFRGTIQNIQWQRAWRTHRQSGIDWLVNAWTHGEMMPPLGWLTPKALIDAAGPWWTGINDDGEYFMRVLLRAAGVVQVTDARVYYRSGIVSYSQRTDPWAWESMLESYELCARHLLSAENSPRVRKAVAGRLQNFRYQAYPRFPKLVDRAAAILQELGLPLPPPHGGGLTSKVATRVLGWRLTRRLGLAAAPFRMK